MQPTTPPLDVAVGISPSLTTQAMGLPHQVEEYWTTLIKGANLIKCGRRGQPHIHFFRLSESQDSLVWESKGRLRRVPLGQVRKILQGQQTQVFSRNKGNPTAKGLEKMSMSLIYGHRQEDRTLDVMCQTEEVFNLWYHALRYVTDQIRSRNHGRGRDLRSPRYATSPSVHGGGQSVGFVNQNLGFPASGSTPGDCYIWGSPPEATAALKQSGLELTKVNTPHLVPSSQKLDLIHVDCGPSHFTGVTRSGHLYTWGSGENGRLGLGSLQHAPHPTTVPELTAVSTVSCGDSNCAAITSDGSLYTWGSGLTGQLGHGNYVTQYLPKRLIHGGFSEVKIRRVSCGPFHSAAVTDTGGVYTWGDGFGGKLGHGNEETIAMPKRVEGLMDVVNVSCGWWHTAAIGKSRNGNDDSELTRLVLYTWGGHCSWNGDNNKGCLGNGLKTGEWFPVRVRGGLDGKDIRSVACGLNLTVALTKEGTVYQMGTTAAEDTHVPWEGATIPTRVEGPLRRIYANQVACGKQHVIVVGTTSPSRSTVTDRKSHVFSWGNGKRGQLGLGSHKDSSMPQFIEDLGPRKVVHVCCGGDYTLIVCSHDHKVAAANTTEMLIPTTPTEPMASSSVPPRKSQHHHSSGQVIKAAQLRLPLRKSPLNYREGVGSMDHISLGSSTPSIRKLKSDIYSVQRTERSRTGSTPLSDAPSEQGTSYTHDDKRSASSYTGKPRTSTPTSLPDSSDGTRHGSNPDLSSHSQPPAPKPRFDPIRSGDADSIVSDPCDHGEESSSDDDTTSCANTDGQYPQDGYSEEDSTVHRSGPSLSEKGAEIENQSVSKNLPESFRMPIMPFPPTADIVPATSARSLSRSMVTAARLRTRQRGLERRLGITDTWASDRLISKENPPADIASLMMSCHYPSQEIIHEEGSQTARESRSRLDSKEAASSQRHRRTTSEQNVYLNSLKESLKNVGDSKTKILNYGKLLESVEERLIDIADKQKGEMRSVDAELSSVLKLLDADENQKQIGSFFEAATVESTIRTVQQLSEALDATPLPETSSSVEQLKARLGSYEQTMTQVKELVAHLQQTLGLAAEETEDKDPEVEERPPRLERETSIENVAPATSQSGSSDQLVHMWMEKVDPGVSIIFQRTPTGTTKIKKIRFAKRMFAWDEAQRWWEQNQERLIRDYQLEPGFDPLNQSASES